MTFAFRNFQIRLQMGTRFPRGAIALCLIVFISKAEVLKRLPYVNVAFLLHYCNGMLQIILKNLLLGMPYVAFIVTLYYYFLYKML